MAQAKITTDHDEIRRWAEARGGRPAAVRSTQPKDGTGIIRIEFPGAPNAKDDNLEEITWDEFFNKHGEKGGKPYEFRESYHENVIVTHPKFGRGFVSEVLSDSKVELPPTISRAENGRVQAASSPHCRSRRFGDRWPTALRNMTLLPAAWGEKNRVTSSSKNVSPVAPRPSAHAQR